MAVDQQKMRMLAALLRSPRQAAASNYLASSEPRAALANSLSLSDRERIARAALSHALRRPVQPAPPPDYRSPFLPLKRTPEGKREWAVPGILADFLSVTSAPGRAVEGGPGFDPEQEGVNFALNMLGGGLLAPRPRGSVGMGGRVVDMPPGDVVDFPVDTTLPAAEPPLLGRYPSTTAGRVVNKTATEGGYSVNLPSGQRPTSGLMMGQYPNADPRNTVIPPSLGPLSRAHVSEFVEKNKGPLRAENKYLGTWRDTDGTVYLDVSRRFDPDELRQAVKYGERTGQLAGYDVGGKRSFPVGNWQEFIRSPEFHARMDEMAAKGHEYLAQHANKEWWDMHGSAFERVYGPGSIDKVAGLTAATAPARAPRENLQVMSEYMRRLIKSEPIIQPDYRTPEGLMSRNPGKQLGMEATMAPNLRRASEGRLTELQADKVREEAMALMGDPEAVVLDRWWARIAEDPNRNIFTDVSEGVIKGDAYKQLKEQVSIAARRAGRDPRDYSADAWTGMRDTVQKHSEAYGVKYQGSAIQGESKSYADHFEDLLQEKADHLGISKAEMESRLRSGDATLLSTLLGAPLALIAFKQWQHDEQNDGS
jgi:hypothetical protein